MGINQQQQQKFQHVTAVLANEETVLPVNHSACDRQPIYGQAINEQEVKLQHDAWRSYCYGFSKRSNVSKLNKSSGTNIQME